MNNESVLTLIPMQSPKPSPMRLSCLNQSQENSLLVDSTFNTAIFPKRNVSVASRSLTLPMIDSIKTSTHCLLSHFKDLKDSDLPGKKNDIMSVLKRKMKAKKKMHPELSKLYGENRREEYIYKKLKGNKNIAFTKDFNVEEYQQFLSDLYRDKLSLDNYNELKKKNVNLNKISKPKQFGVHIQKNGWYYLAKELEYQLPAYLYEKFISLGTINLKKAS